MPNVFEATDLPLVPGRALVPFPLHEFHGDNTKRFVVETEVSPSNFIFAAKNVISGPQVWPAVKNEI